MKKIDVRVKPDRLLAQLRAQLQFGGANAHAAIISFKEGVEVNTLINSMPMLMKNKGFINLAVPALYPKDISELHKGRLLLSRASALSEIFWAIGICLENCEQINFFLEKKKQLEGLTLTGESQSAKATLQEVRDELGYSVWYIQNLLMNVQTCDGLDAQRQLATQLMVDAGRTNIIYYLLYFISKRCEGSSIQHGLQPEVEKFLSQHEDFPDFCGYIRAKIYEFPTTNLSSITGILAYEATSSLIDLYETLISVLQSVVSGDVAPENVVAKLSKPLQKLLLNTEDERIASIMRALGVEVPLQPSEKDASRSDIIDAYTIGEYERLISLTQEALRKDPTDMVLVELEARARARLGLNISEQRHPLDTLIFHFTNIAAKSDAVFTSAYGAMTLAAQYFGQEWASISRVSVMSQLAEYQKAFPSYLQTLQFVLTAKGSPLSALSMRGRAKDKYVEEVKRAGLAPNSLAVLLLVSDGIETGTDLIPSHRTLKYVARHFFSRGKLEEAYECYRKLISSSSGVDKYDAICNICLICLEMERVAEATEYAVDACIENEGIISNLPLKRIIDCLEDTSKWFNSIAIPIIYEIFCSRVSEEKKTHLRFAFERFQLENDFGAPSEIYNHTEKYGIGRVVTYLSRVCIPDTMKQTIIYEGTREIEEERIRICRVLSEIDQENSNSYLLEVKERVKAQEINKGMTLVEQSKVYVDVPAISKSLKSRLNDSYSRYKSMTSGQEALNDPNLKTVEEVVRLVKEGRTENYASLLSTIHMPSLPKTESDAAFDEMYNEVVSEFLTSKHGLNVYLSTRIRHGTLSNTLRKPVEDENLVTNLKEGSGTYLRNEYWQSKSMDLPGPEKAKILEHLDSFSKGYDGLIGHIKNDLLQINIASSFGDIKRSAALFDYFSSNVERKFLQSLNMNASGIDDFIDRCTDMLWSKTDSNLYKVRAALSGTIRQRFIDIFDELTQNINTLSMTPTTHDLLDSIARAKTNLQTKLNSVVRWFNRSEVYDRPDFKIDLPVNIAFNMIKNTKSKLPKDFEIKIMLGDTENLMTGRTLDGLVDVFYALFENAIDYCQLDLSELLIIVGLAFKDEILKISVINNLNPDRVTDEDEAKVRQIHQGLGRGGDDLLHKEGGTGFHKIWKILTSSVYRESTLNFGFDDKAKFKVEIELKLMEGNDVSSSD